MSGISGVLLSYGAVSTPGPFPGVEPAAVMSNVDTITVTLQFASGLNSPSAPTLT